jgi:hypothetical protein
MQTLTVLNKIVVCDKDNKCEYGFVTAYDENSEDDLPFVCYPTDEYILLAKYDDLKDFEFYIGEYFYYDSFLNQIKNYEKVYLRKSKIFAIKRNFLWSFLKRMVLAGFFDKKINREIFGYHFQNN